MPNPVRDHDDCSKEAIAESIDAWHASDSALELHEWLGWAWEEYAHWVKTSEAPKRPITSHALQPSRERLTQYVLYDHPNDHPDFFVVRPFDVGPGTVVARKTCALFRSLDKARAWCVQLGLARMDRSPGDDPKIIEVWT